MKAPVIHVDLGKQCKKCGVKGVAGESGLCMGCIADLITKRARAKQPTKK